MALADAARATVGGVANAGVIAPVAPARPVLGIGVLQGFLLLALVEAGSRDVWPSTDPSAAFSLWTMVLAVPVMLMLSLGNGNGRRAAFLVGGFGVLLGVLAWYVGRQVEPQPEVSAQTIILVFTLSAAVTCFKALIYLQQQANREPFEYRVLFAYSWRNFLIGALALVFVAGVALVLGLWALLFNLVGIDLFARLFAQSWFALPVYGVAFAAGVLIFRNLTTTIDAITRLLEGLIRLLLPLVALLALLFLGSLAVVGMQPLWDTWSGTGTLLWLAAFALFFANAVYQTGREAVPYPGWVHRMVAAGMLAVPLVNTLAGYGLWLRVAQYGWTVERCWAALVWLLLSGLSLGYAYGVVTRRLNWPTTLATVNSYAGIALLVALLAANSPLLDFRKVALASQVARVESGELTWRTFDHAYAQRHLGRPAALLRERLLAGAAADDPELRALIEDPRSSGVARGGMSPEQFWSTLAYRPEPFDVPEDLRRTLADAATGAAAGARHVLFRLDLDADGSREYVLFAVAPDGAVRGTAFQPTEQGWRLRRLWPAEPSENLAEAVLGGTARTVRPVLDDVEIGGVRFEVR